MSEDFFSDGGPLSDFPPGILTAGQDDQRKLLLAAAGRFAEQGFRIIPVRWINEEGECACPRGAECPSPGKHPVHREWPQVASSDRLTVANWWRSDGGGTLSEWWPQANIGIVTGRESRVFVLDVDNYNGGFQTLSGYERRHGALPVTRVHSTARGGTHYFFRHPGFTVRNSAASVLGQGLDIRGENGFVVAPPSVSKYGLYELEPVHDIEAAPAPEWLLAALRSYDKDQTGESVAGAMPTEATGAARRYVEAAVEAESSRMREARSGTRNDTLNQCAFSLGTLGGAGLLSEDAAFSALRDAALAAGLDEGEIRRTFTSGWTSGLESPRNVQWQSMHGTWPARAMTEFGLADRMFDHWGDRLRWIPEWDSWALYEGGVWTPGSRNAGEWLAQAMIRALPDTEALSYDEDSDVNEDGTATTSPRARFLDWVAKQQKRGVCSNSARLAAGIPSMQMKQTSFNSEPMLLNARNGVIDLTTGELLRHSPDYRMTLQCAAPWRREDTPLWDAFLRRVQPDPAMRAYLQRVAGYCATGLTSEQVFFLWWGAGANGKSVAQAVIAHILGTYSQTMPVSALMASSVDDRIPNDVARMDGKRFLVAAESKAGVKLDEARLKGLTGGDTISARYMRAEWFEFKPVGKIQLSTNNKPEVSDDQAIWRRIHVIPWAVSIPEEERDGQLQQKLISLESPGILNWIVQGALAWRDEGLNKPEPVTQAGSEYRHSEDSVRQFIEECLRVVEPQVRGVNRDATTIWSAYEEWRRMNGREYLKQKTLTSRIQTHGHGYVNSGGWRGFPTLEVIVSGI